VEAHLGTFIQMKQITQGNFTRKQLIACEKNLFMSRISLTRWSLKHEIFSNCYTLSEGGCWHRTTQRTSVRQDNAANLIVHKCMQACCEFHTSVNRFGKTQIPNWRNWLSTGTMPVLSTSVSSDSINLKQVSKFALRTMSTGKPRWIWGALLLLVIYVMTIIYTYTNLPVFIIPLQLFKLKIA